MSLWLILWLSISALSSLLMSMVVGHLNSFIAISSLVLGFLGATFASKKSLLEDKVWIQQQSLPGILVFFSFFFLLSFQFTYLLYQVRLDDVWIMTINPNNRGDLPFHINMIRALARGLSIWPDHLFLIDERLKYPFAMNLFNAQFEILGVPLQSHLMITGLVCLMLLMFELYRWMGVWGIFCFFLSGGFGSYLPNSDLEFKNLYLSVFVTQRGFLFALPAGIWLIRNLNRPGWAWIFILATLPFFHLHSFVILFLYFLGLWIIDNGLKFPMKLFSAGLLASPFVLQALIPAENIQVVHWSTYWWTWKNIGAWGGLCLGAFVLMAKKKQISARHLYILFLSLIFSVLILAPWDWDQIKILTWCYLMLNSIIAGTLLKRISRFWIYTIAVVVFFPGGLQVWKSLPKNQFQKDRVYLARVSDVQQIQQSLKEIDANDPVLVAPVYNHPIFFAGQSVVVGYPGHVWSQGADAKKILSYIEDSVAAGKLISPQPFKKEIKWVLNSPFEKEKWPTSDLFSDQDWSLSCVKPGHCR